MDNNADGCQLTNHLAAIYIAAEQHTAAAQALENFISHPQPGMTYQELIHDAATNEAEKHYAFKDLLLELGHEIGIHPADVMEAVNDYHDEQDAANSVAADQRRSGFISSHLTDARRRTEAQAQQTITDEQGDTYTTNSRY